MNRLSIIIVIIILITTACANDSVVVPTEPFKYRQHTDDLSRTWIMDGRYWFSRTFDSVTTIRRNYTDTTITITKVNDTTVQFASRSFYYDYIDMKEDMIKYNQKHNKQHLSSAVILYFYKADSVFISIGNHISASASESYTFYTK